MLSNVVVINHTLLINAVLEKEVTFHTQKLNLRKALA